MFNKIVPLVIAGALQAVIADNLPALETFDLAADLHTTAVRSTRKLKQRRVQEDSKMNKMGSPEPPSKKTKSDTGVPLAPIVQPAGVQEGFVATGAGDLGLRFSKNPKLDPPYWLTDDPEYIELGVADYPLNMQMANRLRDETGAISVYMDQDCDECVLGMGDLIRSTKVAVTFPNNDPESDFWHELWEVVVLQIHRRNNEDIEQYLKLPQIWSGYTIEQVAQAVNDEYPGIHHVALITQLFGGALDRKYLMNCPNCANIDRDIVPIKSAAAFIRGMVVLADMCTWAFGVVGPQNFQTKWHIGRPRPEEVMWKIYNDDLTAADGVPQYIIDGIKNNFDVERMQDFTAYATGSPEHPSFPAMHSASSAASLWLAVVLDLTPQQMCEVKAVDYAVAYARTIAGVHYYTDNIAGLNLGQEILASKLPEYMAHKYGSDPAKVQAKIDKVRFDWNDYLTSDCAQ